MNKEIARILWEGNWGGYKGSILYQDTSRSAWILVTHYDDGRLEVTTVACLMELEGQLAEVAWRAYDIRGCDNVPAHRYPVMGEVLEAAHADGMPWYS